MVDIALGERAQHLVVAGQQLFDLLEREKIDFPGRVGFLRLQSTPPPPSAGWVNLDGQSGVIGRADRFVQTDTEYQHLVSWLLRDTWFVESLADAIQFHRTVTRSDSYGDPLGRIARPGRASGRGTTRQRYRDHLASCGVAKHSAASGTIWMVRSRDTRRNWMARKNSLLSGRPN